MIFRAQHAVGGGCSSRVVRAWNGAKARRLPPLEEPRQTCHEYALEAVLGLVQKYYCRLGGPNQFCGVMLWESKEALAAFRESELFKTVPIAYGIKDAPSVEVVEVFDVLRS